MRRSTEAKALHSVVKAPDRTTCPEASNPEFHLPALPGSRSPVPWLHESLERRPGSQPGIAETKRREDGEPASINDGLVGVPANSRNASDQRISRARLCGHDRRRSRTPSATVPRGAGRTDFHPAGAGASPQRAGARQDPRSVSPAGCPRPVPAGRRRRRGVSGPQPPRCGRFLRPPPEQVTRPYHPADGRPDGPRVAHPRRHLRPIAETAHDLGRPRGELDRADRPAAARRPLRGPAGGPARRVAARHKWLRATSGAALFTIRRGHVEPGEAGRAGTASPRTSSQP